MALDRSGFASLVLHVAVIGLLCLSWTPTPPPAQPVVWLKTTTPLVAKQRHHLPVKSKKHPKKRTHRRVSAHPRSTKPSHSLSRSTKRLSSLTKKNRRHQSARPPRLSQSAKRAMQEELARALNESTAALAKQQQRLTVWQRYQARLREAVSQHWVIPYGMHPGMWCRVTFDLDRSGRPSRIKLTHRSGLAAFDQSALRAVRLAAPLPVPRDQVLYQRAKHITLTLKPEA